MQTAKGTFISLACEHSIAQLLLILCLLFPAAAWAEEFSGYVEEDYSHFSSNSQDATGTISKTKADSFTQRYNLMLNKSLYPQLTLRAGYLFETDQTWLKLNDADSHSSITTSLPSVDLALGNQILKASVGYTKRKEETKSSGTSSLINYNEDYHATLSWRPEGLPAANLLLQRLNTFDGEREVEDNTNDRAMLGLAYLFKNLDLKYLINYSDQKNKLQGLDVKQLNNTGRMSYSGQFFNERVSFYSSYNISRQTTTTSTSGRGVVDFSLTPFAGLFALNFTPSVGVLDPFPSLIDGNTTTSAGINVGTMLPPQQFRNMGMQFSFPAVSSRMEVWVDRRLPDKIARLYQWDVYTSQDNQQTWQRVISVSNLTMDPFQNRFEINYAPVTTQFIKVVVTPLDQNQVLALAVPGFQQPFDVLITEIQGFDEKPALEVQGETTTTSQIFNADVKVRLLDNPSLNYEGSLFYTSSSPGGLTRYTISNGLMGDRRFNEVVSVSGRVAREDSQEPLGIRSSYVYTATLRVSPFQTLNHTLVYSGRNETFQGKKNESNSLFLSNIAEIYRGVNLNTSGGVTFSNNENGEKIQAYNFLLGLNIVPRRDLTFNINYTMNKTSISGGLLRDTTTAIQRGDCGVTYRPFATLYLLASLAVLEQTDKSTDIFQNYGFNWSPFPDGNLQFNFSYAENLQTFNQEKSRLISPSMTWKISARTNLDVSYPILKTESVSGKTELQTLSAILRISF